MRARGFWLSWLAAAALLAGPLHCLGEALAEPSLPQRAAVHARRSTPIVAEKMCCTPKWATAPAAGALTQAPRAVGWHALPALGADVPAADGQVLPRSLGPPGVTDLAARAGARVRPLLI